MEAPGQILVFLSKLSCEVRSDEQSPSENHRLLHISASLSSDYDFASLRLLLI